MTNGVTHDPGLPQFEIGDPDLQDHLYETYASVRRQGALAYSPSHGGYWTLTRYDEVKRAAMDYENFTTTGGVTIPRMPLVVPAIPLELDPPEHTSYRRLLQPFFSPKRVAELEPFIRSTVTASLDAVLDRGTCDLVTDFAEPLPPKVILRILGLSDDDWLALREWTKQMIAGAQSDGGDGGTAASGDLHSYLESHLVERQRNPRDDILSALVNGTVNGEPIPFDRVLGTAAMIAVAGNETTVNGIANTLYLLGTHPEAKSRVLADPSLVAAACDESLRCEAPTQMLARTATTDLDIGGHRLRAGDRVGLLWGCANRDSSRFADSESFDIDRAPSPHVTFGLGTHRCIGEHLARLEMTVAVELALKFIPDYEIIDETLDWTPGINRELHHLHVRFTPRS